MTYEPKTWNSGDIIAADDLNHIEQGIVNTGGSTPLIVTYNGNDDGATYDFTLAEICAAFNSGRNVFAKVANGNPNELLSLVVFGEDGVVFRNINYSQASGREFLAFTTVSHEIEDGEEWAAVQSGSCEFTASQFV